jgi:hypothetical protein
MLVGPAVVPDGMTKLTVGERVDGDDRALLYHLSNSGWPLTPCQNTLMRVPTGASAETTGSLGACTRVGFLGGRSTSGSAVESSIWHAMSCCVAPAAMPVRESSSDCPACRCAP